MDVPELDSAIVTARDDETVVKLKTGDGIIVSAKSVDAFEGLQVEDDDSAVRTTGDEAVTGKLQLPDKRCVTLEESDTFTGIVGQQQLRRCLSDAGTFGNGQVLKRRE